MHKRQPLPEASSATWEPPLSKWCLIPIKGGPRSSLDAVMANATMEPGLFGKRLVGGACWTLAYEIQFYFLAACFFLIGPRNKPEHACLFWLLAPVASMV